MLCTVLCPSHNRVDLAYTMLCSVLCQSHNTVDLAYTMLFSVLCSSHNTVEPTPCSGTGRLGKRGISSHLLSIVLGWLYLVIWIIWHTMGCSWAAAWAMGTRLAAVPLLEPTQGLLQTCVVKYENRTVFLSNKLFTWNYNWRVFGLVKYGIRKQSIDGIRVLEYLSEKNTLWNTSGQFVFERAKN